MSGAAREGSVTGPRPGGMVLGALLIPWGRVRRSLARTATSPLRGHSVRALGAGALARHN